MKIKVDRSLSGNLALMLFCATLLLGTLAIGCGQSSEDPVAAHLATVETLQPYGKQSALSSDAAESSGSNTDTPAEIPSREVAADSIVRRIIYNTNLSLVVKDYQVFESLLPKMVQKHGGYIAKSDTKRRYNDQQSGVWVARIPVGSYRDFIQGVTGFGFAEARREDAQDVTDQYVDVEARIRNNRKLEDRIITMLAERTGKLTDVLEIERELSRVREEIERMEGRLRVLGDRSSLATITIQCREEKEYAPPESPTFASRVWNSWSDSLVSVRRVGESLLIFVVAIVPWLVAFACPVAFAAWIVRRRLWPQIQ